MEKEVWDEKDIWDIAQEYKPLIASLSKKKAHKWHDREDLYQDGYIAAFEAIQKCRERKSLSKYLKICLTYEMEDAAKPARDADKLISLDSVGYKFKADEKEEDYSAAEKSALEYERTLDMRERASADPAEEAAWFELELRLEEVLTEEELQIVRMRREGKTHDEIARELHLSRSAVTKKIKAIWSKLKPERKHRVKKRG